MKKLSLKFYVIAFLIITNIISAVMIFSVVSSNTVNADIGKAKGEISTLLKQTIHQIDDYLDFNTKTIESIAKQIETQQLPLDSSLIPILSSHNENFIGFNSTFAADVNGVAVATFFRPKPEESEKFIGMDYSDSNFYKILVQTKQTTYSEPTLGKMLKKPIITIAAPIFDQNAEMKGFVGGNLSLEGIGNIVRNVDTSNSRTFYVIDQNYSVLASSQNAFNQNIDLSKYKIAGLALSGKTEILENSELPSNQNNISGYAFIPRTNWGIFVSQPTYLFNFFRGQNYISLLLAILSAFAISALIGLLLYSIIIRGIKELAQESKKVSNPGDIIPEFKGSPIQEIQALSEQFRAMTFRLQSAYDVLEKRFAGESEVSKIKEDFIHIVSHELRTPMTITKGYLSMIFDSFTGKIPKDVKSFLKEIYFGNNRLIKMVSNLLDLIEIESGKAEFIKKKIDLTSIVNNTISEFEKENKNIPIPIVYNPKELPEITVDEKWIKKLIIRLLDNALKFTQEGKIEIKHEVRNNQIITAIADTGIGINEEDKKYLFQKLRQINRERNEKSGVGIGLYLSRLIVEHHGGRIWCESKAGNGSTFYFSLPLE